MLDLFSGLGGASEAFMNDQEWSVLRIENNPLLGGVPNTKIDDVKKLAKAVHNHPLSSMNWQTIDLIWASPPCRDFSDGFNSPKSEAIRNGSIDEYKPDMSLLFAAMEIIEKVKPKYWVIENVRGATRYFKEHLGNPRTVIGPYVLWGNFPLFTIDPSSLPSKSDKDSWSTDKLRANKKALIPIQLSQALKDAVESQQSILDY